VRWQRSLQFRKVISSEQKENSSSGHAEPEIDSFVKKLERFYPDTEYVNQLMTQDWLEPVESLRRPETVPPGLVPSTQYIYVRESDSKMVGVIQIRHCFNEFLEKYAGHIGYSVCPSERKKGYATQMLRLVLPECKSLGINRILICCVRGNEGSRRTILNNGGKYESTVYLEERGVYLERYWIDLAESGE